MIDRIANLSELSIELQSRKRPALVTRAGKDVGDNYNSDDWRKYFGIGEYITLKEIHQSFAVVPRTVKEHR